MLRYRSKTIATWIAALGGTLGAHRWYLHGRSDWLAWLHLPPTLLGLYGALRMRWLGQDDRLAWVLVPVLALMISQAMLAAIVYGLTPDEKWDQRWNPGHSSRQTRWAPLFGVMLALLVGSAVLLGAVAFVSQRLWELNLRG